MTEPLRCPYCDSDIVTFSGNKWKYAAFNVERFKCKNCGKSANAFFHGNELSHIIPSGPTAKMKRVKEYLKIHGPTREADLAANLNLPITSIRVALNELESDGVVTKS